MTITTLDHLIDEYQRLVRNCHGVDYADKKATKKNNDAVTGMYVIVDKVQKEFGLEGIQRFKSLLDIEDYGTNIWAATHLLEKATLDKLTEVRALGILEKVALGDGVMALGYQSWMKDWKSKRSK